ncbi:MAG: RelA/SpoT domain-containing protein [Oscillospiraceae bacterium]|nr:RelA/SpoT domain-containing protein [Oscillospiraceae bacterium]
MEKEYFLNKHGIDEVEFERTGIQWDDLEKVLEDYANRVSNYEETSNYIADCLNGVKSIHSIKYRIKDPERLIEKIIRKAIIEPSEWINVKNYCYMIRDIIGIRALHLFKEEWTEIHDYLTNNWELHSAPRAIYKKGDPEQLLESYVSKGLTLNEHAHGYRSLHYNIKLRQGRREMIAEIQVRTLFEDAWSEIDHFLRYGAHEEIDFAEPYLGLLNNITSNADEIASYVRRLQLGKSTRELKVGEEGLKDATDRQVSEYDEQIKVRDMYKYVKQSNLLAHM